jgi:antitoxin CptB
MPGLVPGIHVFCCCGAKGVDGRDKPGHDKRKVRLYITRTRPRPGFWRWRRALATELSSDGLGAKRRRLLFRAWHRGIKEMDIVMGRFADAHIATFTDADMEALEALMEVPDQQMLACVLGAEDPDPEFDTPMFRRLCDFHLADNNS